jgi:hypothetical protein
VLLEAQGSPKALQAEVERLSAQLAEHSHALGLLRGGAAGTTQGFADRLAALARHGTQGVWLDEIILSAAPKDLVLRGHSVDAASIPVYLRSLASERVLSGARFDQLVIDRRKRHEVDTSPAGQPAANVETEKLDSDLPYVRFSVSSNELAHPSKGAGI